MKKNPVDVNPYAAMSEDEMLEKLSEAKEHSDQGMQRDADAVISDRKAKYGLKCIQ